MSTDLESHDLWQDLLRAGAVAPPSEDVLASTRDVVRRAADRELRAARVRRARRRRLRYGVVAAAAAGVIALSALRMDLGGHQVTGESAAAATLRRAAVAALAQQDPVVEPGQYLKVTRVERSWSTSSDEAGTLVGRDGEPAVSQWLSTRTIWIPYDVHQPWTTRDRWRTLRNVTSDPRYQGVDVPVETARTASWAAAGSDHYVETWDPAWYATLPRDPEQLIERLDDAHTGEGSGLAYRFSENYSEILRSGVVPAAVRAALFDGLAELPGMRVDDDVETLDGRRGVAIGARGSTFSMVFDKETGLFIGERATSPDFPDVPGLDADKTTYLTSTTTEVVDHAPDAPYVDTQPG